MLGKRNRGIKSTVACKSLGSVSLFNVYKRRLMLNKASFT